MFTFQAVGGPPSHGVTIIFSVVLSQSNGEQWLLKKHNIFARFIHGGTDIIGFLATIGPEKNIFFKVYVFTSRLKYVVVFADSCP